MNFTEKYTNPIEKDAKKIEISLEKYAELEVLQELVNEIIKEIKLNRINK